MGYLFWCKSVTYEYPYELDSISRLK